MQTILQLPEIFAQDAALFQQKVDEFTGGRISAAEFRSFRVPMGVYEQREADTYMLRVRFTAGGVLPHQMRVLAAVSRTYGDGVLHVTTRQDIQVHRVMVGDIAPALADLYQAGMSTRGGGGNTVRNICGCEDAGVCADEAFDPSPYALALTEFLLPDPLSYQLPRKYKIAFSGCGRDCASATVNDLGLIAKMRDGQQGFAVYVGGGMGAHSRVGELFEPFVPAGEVHYVAEAVKRVFDKHGNRKNRHRARLRFLLDKIGLEAFRVLYEVELAALRQAGLPALQLRPLPGRQPPAAAAMSEPREGYLRWLRANVSAQKQPGYCLVQIPLRLGDIAADTLERLADVAQEYGEGMARATQCQNLVVRWVHESELPELHVRLGELGLGGTEPPLLRNLVSCTGASTCKLGMCLSRGLARAIRERLDASDLDFGQFGNLKIHISGCPNSCGRHPVAGIGLFGAARRVEGRLMPHYVLQLGGKVAEGETRLAEGSQAVPARNVPALVLDLLEAFAQSPECPDFDAFLEAGGVRTAEALVEKHRPVPDFRESKDAYFDWGAEQMFSLAGRGPGECGAGVFDLIEVDLAGAFEAVAQGRAYDATVLAAHTLLVTRGQQSHEPAETFALFARHFLDEKIVADSWGGLLAEAGRAAASPNPSQGFAAAPAEVARFVETIKRLYDGMDPSLRFQPTTEGPALAESATAAKPPAAAAAIDREADFRGLLCPLNYVRTKMVLDQLQRGNVLAVTLDEAGSRNVPESIAKDGHDVLSVQQQEEGHWRVLIRKA